MIISEGSSKLPASERSVSVITMSFPGQVGVNRRYCLDARNRLDFMKISDGGRFVEWLILIGRWTFRLKENLLSIGSLVNRLSLWSF